MYKKIFITYFLVMSFAITKTMRQWPEPKTQACLLAWLPKDILDRIYFFIAESDQAFKARVEEGYDNLSDDYKLSFNHNPDSVFSADHAYMVSIIRETAISYSTRIIHSHTQLVQKEYNQPIQDYIVLGISNKANYLILKKEEHVHQDGLRSLLRSVHFCLFNTLTESTKEIGSYKVQYLDRCPYSAKFNLQQNKIGILNKIYDGNELNGQSKFKEGYHEILIAPEHSSLQDYFAVFRICKSIENQKFNK